MQNDLTQGNMLKNLVRFSLPFLVSSFLQTFYGLADLFFIGRWGRADAITAVSVGSQITHMFTVIIVGLSMGTTVAIGRAVGAGKKERAANVIRDTVLFFAGFALVLTFVLILCLDGVVAIVSTPPEAVEQAKEYLLVCFMGIPLITAYNVISSIFRGLGDSRTPMYFVAAAGIINIILDYLLIGPMALGARGAAVATVAAQGCSVLLALAAILRRKGDIGIGKRDPLSGHGALTDILRVGVPIALQDGFIQVSFLVITAIANGRGVDVAAAVGVVEKLISFFFLVPSAMLSSVSAIASQNAGAGKHGQARRVLRYGICISVCFGLAVALICQPGAGAAVRLLAGDEKEVVRLGAQYLRAYVFDCAVAGIHFCFSGYFCAYGKSGLSFLHNMASVLLVRIPGAYLASLYFPDTLYPMGWAAPGGSLLSVAICAVFYMGLFRKRTEK